MGVDDQPDMAALKAAWERWLAAESESRRRAALSTEEQLRIANYRSKVNLDDYYRSEHDAPSRD